MFHNVLVIKLRVLTSLIAEDVAMIGENLEGYLSIIDCARGFSDFASAAFAEHLSDLVIIDHFSIVVIYYFNLLEFGFAFKCLRLYGNIKHYAYR